MKISLRYNHACFVTTATTSLHIQPCLQHIQHPAQFFIVFLQLLACYSATLLLKHHCKRSLDFKHMQSACSHHQDFKTGASQCISFLAIAHLGNDPHYPALHARVEPCWENVSERNQTHFSGILFPLRFLFFTFISLLRFFSEVGNTHLQLQPAVEVIATVPLGPTLTPGKLTDDSAKKSRTCWDSLHKVLAFLSVK